jgi:phosphoserine aminotransferase
MSQTKSVYNFNAGPAMLPQDVMEIAREEFLNYRNSGMSVMEMSHRGDHFQEILDKAELNLRKLLEISDDYEIAFFPGGATLHFSSIPQNFLLGNESGAYFLTGVWAKKAREEAVKLGFQTEIIYDGKDNNYTHIPESFNEYSLKNHKYIYITSNNTIYGSRFIQFPKEKNTPLIADMTSDLLSRKINVNDFGYIFAGAQKNIGPSGLTVGIIRKDLLEIPKKPLPVLLDYKVYFKNKSLYNTPPTYSIYIAGLVFEWCIKMGGIEKLEALNEKKAHLLYDFIDNSGFYNCPVEKYARSIMNIVFRLNDVKLEKKFNEEALKYNLIGLPGHRDAGGLRASIYNAMPIEGVENLIKFMKYFQENNT